MSRLTTLATEAEAQLARAPELSDERLLALRRLGKIQRGQGKPEAAETLLSALDLAETLGRPDAAREAALDLGGCLVDLGDPSLGRAHLERILEDARSDPRGASAVFARAASELCRAWLSEGDLTRARAALALVDPSATALAALASGELARALNDPVGAAQAFARAIGLAARSDDPIDVAWLSESARSALHELEQRRRLPSATELAALSPSTLAAIVRAAISANAAAAPLEVTIQTAQTLADLTEGPVELLLPDRTTRWPSDGPPPAGPELRVGRVAVRVSRDLTPAQQLAVRSVLGVSARLGEPTAEEGARVLHLLDRLVASDLEGPRLLDLATDLLKEATGAARARLVQVADRPAEGQDFVSRSLLRHVVLTGRALLLEDATESPPSGASESVGARGLRSVLAAPLLGRLGQVLGVLYLDDPGAVGRFGQTELAVATGFTARLGPHLEAHLRHRRAASEDVPPTEDSSHPALREAHDTLRRALSSAAPVLITGEAGVGKGHLARRIHREGDRAESPYVVLPCSSLSDDLLETELFGHTAGAFTDAHRDRTGLFESAHGGTIVLQGLNDASPRLQAELLRVVESGEIRPVGGEPRQVDVRVVSTFRGDPAAAIEARSLRADLFYRLSVLRISLPPLRERLTDLPRLARRLLATLDAQVELSSEALSALERGAWPGNLRELQACLERALLLTDGGVITAREIQLDAPRARATPTLRLNARQLALIDGLLPGQTLQAGEHAQRQGISAATAWRDLSDLVNKGLLEARGKGRGAVYCLRPD